MIFDDNDNLTAYIELPNGFIPEDIDVPTIEINIKVPIDRRKNLYYFNMSLISLPAIGRVYRTGYVQKNQEEKEPLFFIRVELFGVL